MRRMRWWWGGESTYRSEEGRISASNPSFLLILTVVSVVSIDDSYSTLTWISNLVYRGPALCTELILRPWCYVSLMTACELCQICPPVVQHLLNFPFGPRLGRHASNIKASFERHLPGSHVILRKFGAHWVKLSLLVRFWCCILKDTMTTMTDVPLACLTAVLLESNFVRHVLGVCWWRRRWMGNIIYKT
jgi:hypothetical protein